MYFPYFVKCDEDKIIIENRNYDEIFMCIVVHPFSPAELYNQIADKRNDSITDTGCYMYNGFCNPVNGPNGFNENDMADYLQRLSILFQYLGNTKIRTPDKNHKGMKVYSSPFIKVQNGSVRISAPNELIWLAESQQRTIKELASIITRLS